MPVPDPWFSAVIAEGLQRLAAMHLVGTPTDAGLDLACAVWIDTLWYRRAWHPDPDAGRLRRAFAALSGSARRWPAPAELLDNTRRGQAIIDRWRVILPLAAISRFDVDAGLTAEISLRAWIQLARESLPAPAPLPE